jgi:Ca2+-binding RTX toxin-like protein
LHLIRLFYDACPVRLVVSFQKLSGVLIKGTEFNDNGIDKPKLIGIDPVSIEVPNSFPILIKSGVDEIYGYARNDVLSGLGGDDVLYGGSGEDRLFGGEGSDKLYGGTQNDSLYGVAHVTTLS